MLHTLLFHLLFAMQWMTVELADHGPSSTCCRSVSDKQISIDYIEDYVRENNPPCHLKAIRFNTKKGKHICSDPESAWAKEIIRELHDRKKTTTPPKPQTTWTKLSSTTPTTPATTERTTSPKTTTPTVPTNELPQSTENQLPKESPTTTINQTSISTQDLPIPTTTSITQLPSTTEEPTTPRTTKMTSAEAPVTTQPLQFESTASTVITTTTLTTSTVTAAGPQTTTSLPVQKTDSRTVRISTTHPHPTRTLTKEHQYPIFHKKPWTDRRLKKKKRSGLKKAQRKLSG